MIAELLGAIQTIYEILKMAKGLAGFVEANRTEAWFQQSNQVMEKIKDAKTEEEYKQLAKDLRNLWSGSG